MVVLNDLDRYHLAIDVIDRVPSLSSRGGHARQVLQSKLLEHHRYIREHGTDLPEIVDWHWPPPTDES